MNPAKCAFAALVLFAATVSKPLLAQESPQKEKKYAPMPWHLVDTWWDIGKETVFESLAVDVTISSDVPANVNLYIAPIGLGHLDKTPFYGGIQTQSDGNTRSDPKLRRIGHEKMEKQMAKMTGKMSMSDKMKMSKTKIKTKKY